MPPGSTRPRSGTIRSNQSEKNGRRTPRGRVISRIARRPARRRTRRSSPSASSQIRDVPDAETDGCRVEDSRPRTEARAGRPRPSRARAPSAEPARAFEARSRAPSPMPHRRAGPRAPGRRCRRRRRARDRRAGRPTRRRADASADRARRSSRGSSRRRPGRSGRTSSARIQARASRLSSPQRSESAFASPTWSSMRATTKSTRSSMLGRLRVEAGLERQDRRARPAQREHVLELDRRERRLARAEDELPLLLERHRGGPVDQVLAHASGERAERSRRARADHVGVDPRGARGIERVPVVRVEDGDRFAALARRGARAPRHARAGRRRRAPSRAPGSLRPTRRGRPRSRRRRGLRSGAEHTALPTRR